jgi:hypothetical protein
VEEERERRKACGGISSIVRIHARNDWKDIVDIKILSPLEGLLSVMILVSKKSIKTFHSQLAYCAN